MLLQPAMPSLVPQHSPASWAEIVKKIVEEEFQKQGRSDTRFAEELIREILEMGLTDEDVIRRHVSIALQIEPASASLPSGEVIMSRPLVNQRYYKADR